LLNRKRFRCQQCGYIAFKWLGRCPDCGEWDSLVEESQESLDLALGNIKSPVIKSILEVEFNEEARVLTGVSELDRVLGNGLVKGSVILLGGPPGIGKSTLMIQIGGKLEEKLSPVLYVSGEESVYQIRLRAERLGIKSNNLLVLSETNMLVIASAMEQIKPGLLIIDSIQTVFNPEISSSPGTVSQIKECAHWFSQQAKKSGITIILTGHITKEGIIAGPKLLEHIVDIVLYFEEENFRNYRIIRAIKNRYGSINELGFFEMTSQGLKEVINPSQLFLKERRTSSAGSIVYPAFEGSRAFLVEVQALVTPTNFNIPRRSATGVDLNRLMLILAVLEKKLGIKFYKFDIYVNVVGGIKITEPAVDLPIALALCSNLWNRQISPYIGAFGEIGLGGEIRSVTYGKGRIQELINLGFKGCILPAGNLETEFSGDAFTLQSGETLAELICRIFPPTQSGCKVLKGGE